MYGLSYAPVVFWFLLISRFPELRKLKTILSQANQTDATLRKVLMDKN